MQSAGIWMLGAVAVLIVFSGLPVFMVLLGVSVLFASLGVVTDSFSLSVLTALPLRIVNLLDGDLLQALPLYVMMGALLHRLPLADALFRSGTQVFARTHAAPMLSAVGLGVVLAPMNGSVGASVSALSRIVYPRLIARGVPANKSFAVVCAASTLGVVIPPSLVLILLSDAMMRAHTEALRVSNDTMRVINTQDVFSGAIGPAALTLVSSFALAWLIGRKTAMGAATAPKPADHASFADWATMLSTFGVILGLLIAVAAGYVYAVEAAATGAFALVVYGLTSRTLTHAVMGLVLRDAMAVTGALFALLVAATTFTLLFSAFGTDRVVAELMQGMPGGAIGLVIAVLAFLGLCAFVLDAFEIIFVIIPVVMPPLLARAPDAIWVSALTLLALQASFLIPPFGYGVMMARTATRQMLSTRALASALLPFLCAQLAILALTVSVPWLAHVSEKVSDHTSPPKLSDEDVRKKLRNFQPYSDDGDPQ